MTANRRRLLIAFACGLPLVLGFAEATKILLKPGFHWLAAIGYGLFVIVCAGSATFLAVQRPSDRRARVAATLSATVALMIVAPGSPDAAFARLAQHPGSLLLMVAAFMALFAVAAVIAMLLHLVLVFPRDSPLVRRVPPYLLYVTAAAFATVMVMACVRGNTGRFVPSDIPILMMIGVLAGFVLAVPVVMWRQYRRSTFEEKRQIRWPAFGMAVAFLLGVVLPTVSAWRIKLGQPPGQNEVQIGVSAVATPFVLVPITFLIAIFKYRLLDIDLIIRKTITYTIVTFSLVVVYALSVTGTSRLLASRGITGETARLATTAVVAALFVPLRDRVQRRIDSRFYRRKYDDIESVRLLDEGIGSATGLQSLLAEAATRLQQIFVCRAAAILVREPRSSVLTISASIGLQDDAASNVRLPDDSSATASIRNLDVRPEDGQGEEAIAALRARLLVPVRSRGELTALIALGAKMSDEPYDARDERVAAALADRLAAAIENYRFRQLTVAESEWRSLDRISRLVFVALAQGTGSIHRGEVASRVLTTGVAAGLQITSERIAAALSRLNEAGAIAQTPSGELTVLRRTWLDLPDVLRPLELVARDAGQRVGAYEILDRIGRGGMGEVFRATNVHDGSFAAVKILPPLEGRSESRKRFEREGALVAALSHPNIVRVLERGEHDGRLYMAMELIEGETLADAIQRPEWNIGLAMHTALQVAAAMAELHSLGVVHRDVKSSNIMIARGGRAVLLDFGLARDADASSLTADAHIVGSLPYMAPEQVRGTPSDARADIWSFGVVLYECLARRRPWHAASPSALITEIGDGVVDWMPLETLTGVSPLVTIIRESLQPDPTLRIRDGAELLRRLTHAARLTTSAGFRLAAPPAQHPEVPTQTAPRVRDV